MNILVPHSWLKEHLKTNATSKDVQRLLSLSGPSVERIHTIHDEPVYEIEVTTNRMDTASVRGVARDAAVILTQEGKPSSLAPLKTYTPKKGEVVGSTAKFPITIVNDDRLCSRIMAVVLSVKIGKSSSHVSKRLDQIGIRSLNNLIDITNYVMTEIGHPIHAFDADRLGDTMIIRTSKKGEKLTTLDHKTHRLLGGDIVVDNGKGELTDLIGIMGTANSVVTEKTTRVLLFIEHSDPTRIRNTSMSLAIRTTAAQLNEKMLDPNLASEAFMRAIALFTQHASATIESPILDIYPHPVQEKQITLPLQKVREYLGIDLPAQKQIKILEQLGCSVSKKASSLIVTIPTFRPDIEIPVDLIEELARIYGYHNLPSTLMPTPIPTQYPDGTDFEREHQVKEFLASLGWQEVYTYSAVNRELAEMSGAAASDHIRIQNPLNDDHVFLRRSLVPSLMEIVERYRNQQVVSVFELANVYLPRKRNLPEESLRLTLVSTKPFRVVKGDVTALLHKLHIPNSEFRVTQTGPIHADLYVGTTHIGSLVHLNGVTTAGFLWNALLSVARRNPTYLPISPFSPIIEDMTFTVTGQTAVGDVIDTMYSSSTALQRIEVKGQYQQNITFALTFGSRDRQLTSEEVGPMRKAIVDAVQASHDAIFVGKV